MPYFGNQVDTIFDSVGSASNPAVINASSINNGQIGGRRNLIINGAMTTWQRSTSLAGVTETDGYQTADRFQFWTYSGGTYTLSKSTTAPSGFGSSYKVLNTSTTSTVAGTGVSFRQRIEAQDLQQLSYGSSGAKTLTLSFWVRSDTTGVYALLVYSQDGSRMLGTTYTISNADTWEKKTITIVGDIDGTINNDNGIGLELFWWLAAGTDFTSTATTGSWEVYVSTKSAYGQTAELNTGGEWYITGIQLEVGSVATEFENRSYGEELALCQRYYHRITNTSALYGRIGAGRVFSATLGSFTYHLPVPMRNSATLETTGTAGNYAIGYSGTTSLCTALPYVYAYTTVGTGSNTASVIATSTGLTVGQGAEFLFNNTANLYLGFDAEL